MESEIAPSEANNFLKTLLFILWLRRRLFVTLCLPHIMHMKLMKTKEEYLIIFG